MNRIRLPAYRWLGAYAVLCFSLGSLWTLMSLASPLWYGLALVLMTPFVLTQEMSLNLRGPESRLTPARALLGVAVCLPVLIYFAFTVNQEFPFGGDHDHHWLMAQDMVRELGWYLPLVVAAFGGTVWLAGKFKWAYVGWMLAALAVSTLFVPQEYLVRYPPAFYALAAPLNALVNALGGAPDPLLANRLVNVLALPLYVFILRPRLVRRWPDLRLLALVAFFVFQKDWVYYLTTTYLEAWSLIFVFLSLELCVSKLDEDIELAPALAGLGCMFKEQAVFALALTTAVFFFRKRPTWGTVKAGLAAGFYFLPFFTYYSIRANSGVFRKVEPGHFSDLLNPDRWDEFYLHFKAGLGWGGMGTLGLSLILLGVAFAQLQRRWLLTLAGVIVVAAELLYFTDAQSSGYLGYPRFHLLDWPLLALGAVLLYDERPRWRKALAGIVGAGLLLQMPYTLELLRLGMRPDFESNFIEHYYAPVHLPIHELLGRLPKTTLPRHIVVNIPVSFGSFAYSIGRVLHRDFEAFPDPVLTPKLVCECQTPSQVFLLLDVYKPESDAIVAHALPLRPGDLRACAEKLRRSCGQVLTVEGPGNFLAGAIAFTPEGH